MLLKNLKDNNRIRINKIQQKVNDIENLLKKVQQEWSTSRKKSEVIKDVSLELLSVKIEAVLIDWPKEQLESIVSFLKKEKGRDLLLINIRRARRDWFLILYLNPLCRLFFVIQFWANCNEVTFSGVHQIEKLKTEINDFRMQKPSLIDKTQLKENIIVKLLDFLSSAFKHYSQRGTVQGAESLGLSLDSHLTQDIITAVLQAHPDPPSPVLDKRAEFHSLGFEYVSDSEEIHAIDTKETLNIELFN